MEIKFKSIGKIYTEYKDRVGMPIQPKFSKSKGKVVFDSIYAKGLKDLDGFSHIILIYYFNKSSHYNLLVKPFLDKEKRGVFATRSPNRPCGIGISIVKLDKIKENILYVSNTDVLDETPLLDVKPYIKDFDYINNSKQGWIEEKVKENHISDGRFC